MAGDVEEGLREGVRDHKAGRARRRLVCWPRKEIRKPKLGECARKEGRGQMQDLQKG